MNPLGDEGPQGADLTTVRLALVDVFGFTVGIEDIQLGPRQHTALFLTEIFPDFAGINEFEGRLVVFVQRTPGSAEKGYVVALSLRSALEKLTSVPIFQEQHGFAPSIEWSFAQNLPGTAPAIRLALHQNSRDLNVQSVRMQISGASLRMRS